MRAFAVCMACVWSWGCGDGGDATDGDPPTRDPDDPGPDDPGPPHDIPDDTAPTIQFAQTRRMIDRRNEPPSAGRFTGTTTAYGSWLADYDGDGRLDYYAVNHGQIPHVSGLFINNGAGGFGRNLYTVALRPSPEAFPNLDISNEMRFVGDVTGDGKIDLYFQGWSGAGVLCVNQGAVTAADWAGPGFMCYGTADGLAFSDVNGDGRLDILSLDRGEFDTYTAYYSQTARFFWRLNNGNPNPNRWPTSEAFSSLQITDPAQMTAPFCDLNGDGLPDKIAGIALPLNSRGMLGTTVGGHQVFLGQPGGSYAQAPAGDLDSATDPITRIEDVDEDGCIDVGTDASGYRDNQRWYLQTRADGACTAQFTLTPRTQLPYFPGFKRYSVDLDNSGRLSKIVLIHRAYGNNDGLPAGATTYHKRADGSYARITAAASGIDITAGGTSEFYADNLSPGDWNDDGRIDLAGTGQPSIANSDEGFALWTSQLTTTNRWIKLTLPTVTGVFAGSAAIEVYERGFAGDPAHLVTPARVIYPGKAWATLVYHFGIGGRYSVDVRVRFPDGTQVVRTGVVAASRTAISP